MIKKVFFILFLAISTFGFSQEKSIQNLVASPNPFINNTTISLQASYKQEAVFSVKNVLGKTVYFKNLILKKGKNTIPFYRANLKAGMYIYTLQNKTAVISKRFVIK